MRPPLDINKIRSDGPHERLGNSYGKVRNNGQRWHRGWDLSAETGTPVHAVADGRVIHRYANVTGYGQAMVLEIDNPRYDPWSRSCSGIASYRKLYAVYAHLSQMFHVGRVNQGDVIGYTGTTGNAGKEAPHLHFEILLEDILRPHTPRVDPGEVLGYSYYVCEGRVGR